MLGNEKQSEAVVMEIEVRDFPARDICFLHVVLQGSHQMGRVLGTPPPPPPPSPPSVVWKFRSTFWLGNYIWTLSLWNWALVEALDALRPGFCTEFRYLSDGQSGLAWGAIFEKMPKYQENALFQKYARLKNPEMSFFRKHCRRPNVERSL